MKRDLTCVFLLTWCLLATGCGKSDKPATPAETGGSSSGNASDPAAAGATPNAASATPAEAVNSFFKALRDGDEQTVTLLLTERAREESKKNGVAINPPGDAQAVFAVGEVAVLPEGGAHVRGAWTETTSQGTQTIDIVWILRQEAAGWRIAGLAARTNDENVVLNFEDPTELSASRGIGTAIPVRTEQPRARFVRPRSRMRLANPRSCGKPPWRPKSM